MGEATIHNLLIVAQTRCHLLLAVETSLKNAGYQVTSIPAEMEAINAMPSPINGLLVYADEKLLEEHQALHFLRDRSIAADIPVFVLGAAKDLDALKEIIPPHCIQAEFVRPLHIHVSHLVEQIDSRIKQHSVQKKILVVDDSGAWLRNVKGWLEEKYSVLLANSGAMTIKYLTLNQPDLVLLDYEMPVVDGRQVLEMIRSETEFAHIPVIFLTKRDDAESVMNVKSLRPEGYLLKTLPPAMIVKAVDDFFELKKGLDSLSKAELS